MAGSRPDDSLLDCVIADVLQVILSSRFPCGGGSYRDGGFNLRIRECPAGGGLRGSGAGGSMVVDVILVDGGSSLGWVSSDSSPRTPLAEESAGGRCDGKVIERWVLRLDVGKGGDCGDRRNHRSWSYSASMVRERLMLLMRSLYVMVRLLPAYKTARSIASLHQGCSYSLAHRVLPFSEPFENQESEEFRQFGFAPVDIMNGRLCLSVLYRASTLDLSCYPSVPLSSRIIPDYIGSALADQPKGLPLFPVARLQKPTLVSAGSASDAVIASPLGSTRQGLENTKRSAHIIKNVPANTKVVSERRGLNKDKHVEVIPSCSFAQISFIKCYRRSSWNDFDYDEITCPFDIDEDHTLSDFIHRPQPSDGQGNVHRHDKQGSASQVPIRKSQDAFVGTLVDMLMKAPPLREELQHSVNLPRPSSNSRTGLPKTTADAMEELKSYRKMLLAP